MRKYRINRLKGLMNGDDNWNYFKQQLRKYQRQLSNQINGIDTPKSEVSRLKNPPSFMKLGSNLVSIGRQLTEDEYAELALKVMGISKTDLADRDRIYLKPHEVAAVPGSKENLLKDYEDYINGD